MSHRVRCPRRRLVFVARGTSIRHLVLLCHGRRDELEGVCAHKGARNALGLDLRHVTGYALTARAAVLVMSMLLHGRYVWTVRRRCTVAIEADLICRLAKLGIVFCTVYVMARGAGYTLAVHHALYKIIALHSVFVSRPVGEMSEGRLPKCVIFEFPVVRQTETDSVAYGPVVSLAFDLLRERLSLGVAGNTSVIRGDVVQL